MNLCLSHIKVILLCVAGAVAYGIIHDQITARLCIEYFTIAHPPLPWLNSNSPTLVGLAWGVAATFWVGLALGFPMALASQSPPSPPVPLARLGKAILLLLATMAVAAMLFGLAGFELSRRGILSLPEGFSDLSPSAHYHRFMAVWFAHGASYLFGLLGGLYLIISTWNQRGRPAILQIFPHGGPAVIRTILVVMAAGVILWFRFFRH